MLESVREYAPLGASATVYAEGKHVRLDETMEEVGAVGDSGARSENHERNGRGVEPFDGVYAPLSAPPRGFESLDAPFVSDGVLMAYGYIPPKKPARSDAPAPNPSRSGDATRNNPAIREDR